MDRQKQILIRNALKRNSRYCLFSVQYTAPVVKQARYAYKSESWTDQRRACLSNRISLPQQRGKRHFAHITISHNVRVRYDTFNSLCITTNIRKSFALTSSRYRLSVTRCEFIYYGCSYPYDTNAQTRFLTHTHIIRRCDFEKNSISIRDILRISETRRHYISCEYNALGIQ